MDKLSLINATVTAGTPRLRDLLSPFVASVSSREPHSNVAKHFGSGSFVSVKGRPFLLSNAHVLGRTDLVLGVVLKNGAEMHTLSGAVPQSEDADLAVMEIPSEDWKQGEPEGYPVRVHFRHRPWLFWVRARRRSVGGRRDARRDVRHWRGAGRRRPHRRGRPARNTRPRPGSVEPDGDPAVADPPLPRVRRGRPGGPWSCGSRRPGGRPRPSAARSKACPVASTGHP